ncbi:unnamed protein product [Euphydryas editha]|uniref:SWIM-type domain-containing protein n=2 Tax=Euphydryas editha TaxID=104508 RepID=A0AAU9UEB4_EUPED|nr:unnamed protein product [Euphydryas editha]
MLLNITDILLWTGNNPNQKNIHDAQLILSAGHLFKCGINSEKSDNNVTVVTALCIQTSHMKEKPHEINAKISKAGKIIAIACSCKAGLGEMCKHAVATLFYCYRKGDDLEIFSCTDLKCSWRTAHTNALKKYDPAPITDHPCFSKSKGDKFSQNLNKSSSSNTLVDDVSSEDDSDSNSIIADDNITVMKKSNSSKKSNEGPKYLLQNPTPEQYTLMFEKIKQGLPESAFTKHLLGRHEPIVVDKNSTPSISDEEKAIISAIFLNQRTELMEDIKNTKVNYKQECCKNTMKDYYEDFEAICANTKLNYADWHKARRFRITGSVCYKLYTYTKNKKPDWKKQAKELFDPSSFTSEYTEYGKKTEAEARSLFIEKVKKTVVETGLVISKQNPWLAYSPDGIILTDGVPSALLEIKCPFKGKSKGIIETV